MNLLIHPLCVCVVINIFFYCFKRSEKSLFIFRLVYFCLTVTGMCCYFVIVWIYSEFKELTIINTYYSINIYFIQISVVICEDGNPFKLAVAYISQRLCFPRISYFLLFSFFLSTSSCPTPNILAEYFFL